MCDTRAAHDKKYTHTNSLLLRVRVAAVAAISIFFLIFNNNNFCFASTRQRLRVALSSRPAVLHGNRRNWLNGSRRLDIIAVAYLEGESIFVVKTPQRKYTS